MNCRSYSRRIWSGESELWSSWERLCRAGCYGIRRYHGGQVESCVDKRHSHFFLRGRRCVEMMYSGVEVSLYDLSHMLLHLED